MQFITNGFQTTVVKQYGITSNEVKFLDWFYQFFSTGKMTAIKNRTNNKYYFYIDYSYVMDSIQSISWNDDFRVASQMLRRILNGLESKNVIEKVTLQTQTGRKVYVRFIEKALGELRSKEYANSLQQEKSFKDKRLESRKGREDAFEECNMVTKESYGDVTKMLHAETTEMSQAYRISSQTTTIQPSIIPSCDKTEGSLVKEKDTESIVHEVIETVSDNLAQILKSNNLESKADMYIKFCTDKLANQITKRRINNANGYLKSIILSGSTMSEFVKQNSAQSYSCKKQSKSWKPQSCSTPEEYLANDFFAGIR